MTAANPPVLGGVAPYLGVFQVDDVDAWWKRAVQAGAEVLMPVSEMFWGDRYGQLRDPFGIKWSIAAPIKKSSP
jgi:uncharacterized glyoxalase superfamily protein PhnB